jgi:hypothetical protein
MIYHDEAKLEGRLSAVAVCRDTGIRSPLWEHKNGFTAPGRELFLDLIRGASTAWLDGSVLLRLYNSGGTLVRQLSADGAPNLATARQMVWTFSDISIDQYTAQTARLVKGSTDVTTVTPAWAGTPKTNAQNIIYTYTISWATGGTMARFTEPVSFGAGNPFQGLHAMFQRAANQASAPAWDAANVKARFFTAAGYGNQLHDRLGATGLVRSGNSLIWTFLAPAQSGASGYVGVWQWGAIFNQPLHTTNPTGFLRLNDEGFGTKGASDEWTLTYTFTLT